MRLSDDIILTWKPKAEANLEVATFVLAFILSPIPFLDIADSDLRKYLIDVNNL